MAKAKADNIYDVTVHGQYVSKDGEGRTFLKKYEITFRIPQKRVKDGVRSVFHKTIKNRHMPNKYEDFQSVATCFIGKVECHNDPDAVVENPELLTRLGLIQYIENHELPVIEVIYPDDESLRQAIYDCEDHEEIFIKHQKRTMELRGPKLQLQSEMDDLNPLSDTSAPPTKGKSKDKELLKGV